MKIKTRKLTLRSLPFRWRFSGLSEYFLAFMCARKSLKCATYIKLKRELINSRLKPCKKQYSCRARVSSIYQAASFAFLEGPISRTNSYTPAWSSSWIQEINLQLLIAFLLTGFRVFYSGFRCPSPSFDVASSLHAVQKASIANNYLPSIQPLEDSTFLQRIVSTFHTHNLH